MARRLRERDRRRRHPAPPELVVDVVLRRRSRRWRSAMPTAADDGGGAPARLISLEANGRLLTAESQMTSGPATARRLVAIDVLHTTL